MALSASDMVYAVSIVISNLELNLDVSILLVFDVLTKSTLDVLGFKCFVGSTFDLFPETRFLDVPSGRTIPFLFLLSLFEQCYTEF